MLKPIHRDEQENIEFNLVSMAKKLSACVREPKERPKGNLREFFNFELPALWPLC